MFRRIMMDNERNELDFREVSRDCPWRFHSKSPFPNKEAPDGGGFSKCRPIEFQFRVTGVMARLKDCTQKNCPLMHFKIFFARH